MSWDYPKAEKRRFSYECAGRILQDDYAWMEKNDEDTHAFVAKQNAFTSKWFDKNGDVGQRAKELAEKSQKPSYSNIEECHGKLYACRTSPDGETAAVLLDTDFNELKTLMDSEMAAGAFHTYSVSPCPADEDIIALFVLKNGEARPSVILKNIATDEIITVLDGIFSFTWAPDSARLYYSDAITDAKAGVNHNTVRVYDMNSGRSSLLYTEKDNAVFIMLEVADTGDLFIHVNLSYGDVRLLHMNPLTREITKITHSDANINHYVGSIGGTHYIFTNENAPRGKLVALQGSLLLKDAQDILPEEERPLEGAVVVNDRLLAVYLNDVVSEAVIYDAAGEKITDMPLPDEMGAISLSAENPPVFHKDAQNLYLNFESFTCPPSILRYNLASNKTDVVYSLRGSGPRTDITVERKVITARDGARLLAFLVYKDGHSPDGDTPTLMYGYGGYNASSTPWYNAHFMGLDIVDWVDRGGMYVHCIIRGGGEFGAEWHNAGNLKNKKNAFYDFIDITEWLVKEGWTRPDRIAINGGSNGGLLVTALVTMRPDLFGAVIASVPHTDMIRFCYDDRGPMYTTEYGDPQDPDMFEYMLSYSPYHNIKENTAYPPIYVQTGEFDNNVPPYHGKKFAAKMQAMGGEAPCLLRVLARGSHNLGTGDVYYNTSAEMQIFAEKALGM